MGTCNLKVPVCLVAVFLFALSAFYSYSNQKQRTAGPKCCKLVIIRPSSSLYSQKNSSARSISSTRLGPYNNYCKSRFLLSGRKYHVHEQIHYVSRIHVRCSQKSQRNKIVYKPQLLLWLAALANYKITHPPPPQRDQVTALKRGLLVGYCCL